LGAGGFSGAREIAAADRKARLFPERITAGGLMIEYFKRRRIRACATGDCEGQ
jgi:hypothetical protein